MKKTVNNFSSQLSITEDPCVPNNWYVECWLFTYNRCFRNLHKFLISNKNATFFVQLRIKNQRINVFYSLVPNKNVKNVFSNYGVRSVKVSSFSIERCYLDTLEMWWQELATFLAQKDLNLPEGCLMAYQFDQKTLSLFMSTCQIIDLSWTSFPTCFFLFKRKQALVSSFFKIFKISLSIIFALRSWESDTFK